MEKTINYSYGLKLNINNLMNILMGIFLAAACLSGYLFENPLISFVLTIPVVIIGLYKTYVDNSFAIYVVLFLSVNSMGILPSVELFGGEFSWADFSIGYAIYLMILLAMTRRKYSFEKIGIFVLIYMLFIFIGCMVGKIIYDQDILTGFMVFRKSYIYLSIIPIIGFVQNGIISKQTLLHKFEMFAKLFFVICLIQYLLLYANVSITNYDYKMRWGYRLYCSAYIWIACSFLMFHNILSNNKVKNSIFWLVAFIFGIVFISQSRVGMFGTVCSFVLLLLIHPRTNKKYYLIIVALCILIALFSIPITRNVIIDSINDIDFESAESTMSYRVYERMYFDRLLEGHKFFGVGIPNMNKGLAAQYSGKLVTGVYDDHYLAGAFTSDLGIYAIQYHFGILGLVIFLTIMVFSYLKVLYRIILRKDKNIELYLLVGTMTFFFITCSTLCGLMESASQFLVIFLFASLSKNKNEEKNDGC